MPDEIQLLSDHIANQIAAGEVIQRPGSAVKELLENAIDAGATELQLIVKDAGKELIQVIDNGKGMSVTDARMSFERHATSKIKHIEDLFTIRTMGFRGEALASIAAVAQVEMKTRQRGSEAGTRLIIEGTEVKLQEPCATNEGTNIMVKNLFFNVPARRHFLKTGNTEFRYIVDEFTRVALAYPAIGFRLWHNGSEQFHMTGGKLKERIVDLLGKQSEKNLVPVNEVTELITIQGYIGKPQAATKTRGNQFFFINNRFIRNNYLNHAVAQGYQGMIEKDAFPFYVLFITVDPSRVDVNVHPTKQEVKFEDDRIIYAHMNAAVKQALAHNNIAPAIDFTLNADIQQMQAVQLPPTDATRDQVSKGYLNNVFSQKEQAHIIERKDSLRQWKSLYELAMLPQQQNENAENEEPKVVMHASLLNTDESIPNGNNNNLLLHNTLLVTTIKSGMMLIHIRRAQERIWYERLLEEYNNSNTPSQRMLFPASYELSAQDALLLQEVLPDLARIGFDISAFGNHTFVVQGIPSGMPSGEEKNVIDEVIEHLKNESSNAVATRTEQILTQLARRLSRNKHAIMQPEGQQALIDELFACTQPEYTPEGKKVFAMIKKEELEAMLD